MVSFASPLSSGLSTPRSYYGDVDESLLHNDVGANLPWVIQKYGGTSVGKSLDSITQIVESYLKTNRVAIVCSARSTQTKALGTTNLLLQASREALQPSKSRPDASGYQTPLYPKRVGSGFFSGSMISSFSSLKDDTPARSSSPSPFHPISGRKDDKSRSHSPTDSEPTTPTGSEPLEPRFHQTVDTIKRSHLDAARATLKEGPLRDELEEEIERDCEVLRSFLNAAHIIDEISPRSQDSIIGTGERLACKIVAAALRDRGVDSELVVLDNIVDAAMTAATDAALTAAGDQGVAQLGQSFYDELAVRLGERLKECGPRVPVITGYFGAVPGSLLAQIGRGYTDLCAALCAVGVAASELQVWKEVDGIFTADPRKVPTARLVPSITPDEAAELTYYGSEVIHPFTMEQVIRAKIPIRIKNVDNPGGPGTIILPDQDFPVGLNVPPPAHLPNGLLDRMPTAVTIKDQIIVLNIHSNRKTISHGFLARIFGTLDRAGVVVDLISTSEVHVSMAMQHFLNPRRLERLIRDLEKIGDITVSNDMAILSLVGRNMRNAIGSAGLMFASLAKAEVNIEMISQGASEINISCVIENKDAIKALNIIHDSCLAIPAPPAANGDANGGPNGYVHTKALTVDTVNPAVLNVEYAVRGELNTKAELLATKLADGEKLPFEHITYANIGNPQEKELKQKPLTYWRQVASLVEYPDLLKHPLANELFPADALAKATQLHEEFGSVGAYTGSKGSLPIRQRVAKFIEARDGFPADPEHIYLTGGATPGVWMILGLALRPGDGALIPRPQYPVYTACLAHLHAVPVSYSLNETEGWALDLTSLKKAIARGRNDLSIKTLKALVVINPGNPTGSCLSEENMREIVQIAYDESLLLLADEVYQTNVYEPERKPFISFKQILRSMPEPIASSVELVSFHSISKGVSGECGRRGGYIETVNLDAGVEELLLKMASISLCAPVSGQIGVDLLVSPPQPGSPSHELFVKESRAIHEGMRDRSAYMCKQFNALEGVSCQPAEGAMYLFPQLTLPARAIDAAKKAGKEADVFYALALLDATGICTVAGSGFGQEDGTYHLRVTTLAPGVEDMMARIAKFHADFLSQYA
ncbi:Aspartokinase [Vanrija albida]|uniref:aspartate kinase n=1 Tax=Vanrija albida TaxID=181172 RepID=A0ABR3QDJ9_9TREE